MTYDRTIVTRADQDTVDRIIRITKAVAMATGTQPTSSEITRRAIDAELCRLEAEYADELARVDGMAARG